VLVVILLQFDGPFGHPEIAFIPLGASIGISFYHIFINNNEEAIQTPFWQ
jgi:hypothetical protein